MKPKGYNHRSIEAFRRIEEAIKKIISNGKRSDVPGAKMAQNLAQKLTQRRICKAAKCSEHTLHKYWKLQAKLEQSGASLFPSEGYIYDAHSDALKPI